MISLLSKGYQPDLIAQTCITKRKGMISPEIFSRIVNKLDDQTGYYLVLQKYLYDDIDHQIRLSGIKNLQCDPIQTALQKWRNSVTL